MFISQTLSSLHSEILQQLRISFFGFGLALGSEYQSLSQLVGGKSPALELYRLFRDPHSSFDIASRQYSFNDHWSRQPTLLRWHAALLERLQFRRGIHGGKSSYGGWPSFRLSSQGSAGLPPCLACNSSTPAVSTTRRL